MIQNRKSTSRVRACEFHVHPALFAFAFAFAFARGNFLLHAAKKNWRTTNIFSFKERPNMNLYVEYSRTLI